MNHKNIDNFASYKYAFIEKLGFSIKGLDWLILFYLIYSIGFSYTLQCLKTALRQKLQVGLVWWGLAMV